MISLEEAAITLQVWATPASKMCLCVCMCLDAPESIQFMSEWSSNSGLMVLQVKVQWTVSWTGFMFFSEPARYWHSGCDFLWWSASIPVQAPSITHTHTHEHNMHTNTSSACNQDGFYVQGPSIIHGIFNVNRLLQFVTISDWSLRWAAAYFPSTCPSLSVSYYIRSHSLTFIVCQVSKRLR